MVYLFTLLWMRDFKNWPDYHHRINLVYHGIIATSLVPFAIVFLEVDSGKRVVSFITSLEWLFISFVIVIVGLLSLLAWKNVSRSLNQIIEKTSIKEKLEAYFKLQLRRYLLLEFGALISLVGLWLTANYIFIISYLIVLVQFSLIRPSQDKVIRDLQFDQDDRTRLRSNEL